jgi:hypothetical protein
MGMVAPQQWIASANAVMNGRHGDVSRYAAERGVCRQRIYREAAGTRDALTTRQQDNNARHRTELQQVRQQLAESERLRSLVVVLDKDKQAEVASFCQARGVSLRDCRTLLKLVTKVKVMSVASLGRRTKAAGARAGQLLAVFDEAAQKRVREVAADEIYVKAPVLMVVEPESLCWLSGRLSGEVSGTAWEREFAALPNLEQVTRDGGSGLAKGVALVNAQRQTDKQELVVDQGDHFHAMWGGGVGLRKAELQARQTFAAAEAADKELAACDRQGHKRTGPVLRVKYAWLKAEKAMDHWQVQERLWHKTKKALLLFTPTGELNTRAQAAAVLAETLPQLPDSGFAKTKRQLQKPEMLNYLDRVERKLAALPIAPELQQAALRQEGLRRRPEALQGANQPAAALRGILMVCAVVLSKAGDEGQQAVAAIREILRRAHRASSIVECLNSVLRMQQAGHRQMTQGLLDLKRLYWNCHTFATGHRRKTTPYQRLGVTQPEGVTWWEVLKMTPEQLREKLSTAQKAA